MIRMTKNKSFISRARSRLRMTKNRSFESRARRKAQDDRLVIVGLTKTNLSCHSDL